MQHPTRHPSARIPQRLRILAMACTATLAGCASVVPLPLAPEQMQDINRADAKTLHANVPPVTGPLTLEEALARALKYNLDRRVKMLEEAIAHQQLDLSSYDTLPRLLAQSGYTHRSNDRISESRDAITGEPSTSRFISQDRGHGVSDLNLSWSMVDFGLGYLSNLQQADRVLIALERRRKAMHLLAQDVRIAFWRTAAAQELQERLLTTVKAATAALEDARKVEASRLRNPAEALRYQRQILENLRLLEAIGQELSAAQVDLAALINAPLGHRLEVAEPNEGSANEHALQLPIERLEEIALRQNADLREQHYNARIARIEARKTLVKLFPNISLNYSLTYDTDRYLVNNRWNEAGLQLSFNLLHLLTSGKQQQLANAGIALADQRRLTTHMAVLTQVHLARLHWDNALRQHERNQEIYQTDRRLAQLMTVRESVQAQSLLDRVSADTAAILSLLRQYQSAAQLHAAEARLEASLGLDPAIGSVDDITLDDLARQLKRGRRWNLRDAPVSNAERVPAMPQAAQSKPASSAAPRQGG